MEVTKSAWNKYVIFLGILPALLLYIALGIGPSLATVILSFTNISGIPGAKWQFIGWENYREFFVLNNYRDTLAVVKRTFEFTLATTIIQNGIALIVALLLNNKLIKGRNFYRAVIFLPVVLGVTITGTTWVMFFSMDGPASMLLKLFNTGSGFFGDRSIAFTLCIFVQIWMSLGWSLVIFLAGLQGIPGELYESGSIDGTTSWQKFRYITFPMLWGTTSVNIVLAIIGSLSSFQTIFVTTAGNFETDTLAMRIFTTAFSGRGTAGGQAMRQGYAASQSMVLFLIILTLTLVTQYFLSRKERENER